MGGDFGLPVTIPAAIEFARQFPDSRLLLVGLPDAIEAALAEHKAAPRDRLEIVPATEVGPMDDPVGVARRRKKDLSLRPAAQADRKHAREGKRMTRWRYRGSPTKQK